MDRFSRILSHNKGTKIGKTSKAPLTSEGNDGDMKINNGALYIKDGKIWYEYAPVSALASTPIVFMAALDGDQNISAEATIQFDSILLDTAKGFATEAYKYTVKIAGIYFFGASINIDTANAVFMKLQLAHSEADGTLKDLFISQYEPDTTLDQNIERHAIVNATLGDRLYATCSVESGTSTLESGQWSNLYGFKIN